jgi:glycosyltransferase involved in cell wall biosynthesis
MKLTNDDNKPIDFHLQRPKKRWIKFEGKQTIADFDLETVKAIFAKFPYWRWKLEEKDIAYVTKGKEGVTFHLKNGEVILQKKPEEMRFEKINKHLDMKKIQIAIFMKHISGHYSGGRYWAWLLGHILAEHPNIQVVFVTNILPPFGESFCDFDTKDLFIYESDPHKLYHMGDKIPVNVFDYVIGIPQEGGVSAMNYANKWGVPFYSLLYESPNFIRDFRGGADSEDANWAEYLPVLKNSKRVINNTVIGKDYLDKWTLMTAPYNKNGSTWLWNSINTKAADKVNQEENSEKDVYHIMWVGRMIEFKRTVHIVRALNKLNKLKFVVHIISGSGGSIFNKMAKECDPHVELKLHLKVDDHEKFRIIKLSNMMVFLSSFEGFGMPPQEAMYCERVCCAYDLPILKHIYKDNVIFSPQGDVNKLAKNIKTYLTDKKKKEKQVKKAKQYCDDTFNHDVIRKNFLDIVKYNGKKNVDVSKIKKDELNFLGGKTKLTFGIIVCNGAQFIIQQLEHIYDTAHQIIIVEGAVEIFNSIIGMNYSNDGTIELIKDFIKHRDPKNKIEFVSCKSMGRAWKDKLEMQNKIAELTKGNVFVKQDVDEFYDLKKLLVEVNRLQNDPGRIMINYQSLHFWGDFNHIIKGANFNDKQTRVWKWKPTYRHVKTFNVFTDIETNKHIGPDASNMFVSDDKLFHYSYIYAHKNRANILKYYKLRSLPDHGDVSTAWLNRNETYLKEGRKVEPINVKHPISESTLRSFLQ